MADKTFTISMDALLAQGPIWYEDGGFFVTLASDLTSFEAYQREVRRRGGPGRSGEASGVPAAEGSIASMVSQMPEQSLSGARLGQPERHPVAMMLGCKYNQNRFRIETDGDITMENGYGSERAHRFFFDMGRWSREANYSDPGPSRRLGPARHFSDGSMEVVPAWPHAGRRDGIGAIAAMALLACCAAALPPALGPKPDPAGIGTHDARPEWFFLWVNELLRLVPGTAFLVAGVLPGLLAALAIALPLLARGAARDPRRRVPEIAAAAAIVLAIAGLTAASLARTPEPAAPAEAEPSPPGPPTADDSEARAAEVMEKFRCAVCHRIDGAESPEDTAPPLERRATAERPAVRDLYTR